MKKFLVDSCLKCPNLVPFWLHPKISGGFPTPPSGYMCKELMGRHIPVDDFGKVQPDCPLPEDE